MFKNFTFRYRCNINDVVTDVTAVLQIRMKYMGSKLETWNYNTKRLKHVIFHINYYFLIPVSQFF